MQNTFSTPVVLPELDLGIEALEPMEAPGFWDTLGGLAAGTVVGGGVVYGAIAVGVAVT
jgi:hypothetical protein